MKLARPALITALIFLPLFALAKLDVSAVSAIIIETETGKVLWEKDADTKRYPASTTKIMTALLMLENLTADELVTAPPDIEKVTESSMVLKPYEQVPAKDLMYAVMLRSANDGAHAAAVHIGGSLEGFAKMMNERAHRIGAVNTHFTNPHGLNDPYHLTTARDLAIIAREAMKHEVFREMAKAPNYTIRRSVNVQNRLMRSRNRYLARDPSADGIKTGYTRPAGFCYVGSATRDGYQVITVVLKSENWMDDHARMLDWAFENHEKRTIFQPNEPVADLKVVGGKESTVPVSVAQPVPWISAKNGMEPERQILSDEVIAPVEAGTKVGEMVVRDADGFEQRVDLVAQNAVELAPLLALRQSKWPKALMVVIGGALFLGAYVVRTRARRILDEEEGA
jgi:serine-type D-Ala-D-Ala carboxypeptidase (penicillin-binding protein 5/6)